MRRLALASLLALTGCARCAGAPVADAGPPPFAPPAALPAPAPWAFAIARLDFNVALPDHCKTRAPLVRAPVAAATRFLAEARSLATLVVADGADDPPRLTGVGALPLNPAGPSGAPRPLPWFAPSAVPRLGRTAKGAWIAGFDLAGDAGSGQVALFRDGTTELLGEGDGFEAIDLGCEGERCALLTSRLARVAPNGAALWTGAATEPAARWKMTEIVPAEGSEARGFGLAAVDATPAGLGVTAALVDRGEALFYRVDEGPPRELGRLPAPYGVIDAIMLGARPVAMAYGTPLDNDGCTPGGGGAVRIERGGLPGATMKLHAPPLGGSIRRLGRGALATWIAPLGCRQPRKVVYAVVLDADGAPLGEPMAVADAVSYAVAASGADVDLYLHEEQRVTWVRLTCAAP